MGNLEIAKIQNTALKAAALEVDGNGNKDGYIDCSEINLFKDKATDLLNEKKCTAQEFTSLFATDDIDKTNPDDVFAKLDSIHKTKNTPEALAKDAEEAKQAEKQQKIEEIKTKIADNNEKLKLYEERLSQKEISIETMDNDEIKRDNKIFKRLFVGGVLAGFAGFLGAMVGRVGMINAQTNLVENISKKVLYGCSTVSLCGALAFFASSPVGFLYDRWKYNNAADSQNNCRNAYKDAYIKVHEENKQLKAELAELQK